MDRLGFLKRLGILATASLIPDWAVSNTSLPVDSENVIPYNPNGGIENEIYKNNMFIQRKTYFITGSYEGNTVTFVHNPMFDEDIELYKKSPNFKVTEC